MDRYFLTFVKLTVIAYLFSCNSKNTSPSLKLRDDLRTYFAANMIDSTQKLDSFQVLSIDTITKKMHLLEQSEVLGEQLHNLVDLYKLYTQKMSSSVDQMKLYRMLESQALVDIEKNDFDKDAKKSKDIKIEIDTLIEIIKSIDSLTFLADTIQPIGFQAKCFYQIRHLDKSVDRDTTFILLNKNKDIIKRKDFLALPYTVDYDKLR